jgi:hypothetical protein
VRHYALRLLGLNESRSVSNLDGYGYDSNGYGYDSSSSITRPSDDGSGTSLSSKP